MEVDMSEFSRGDTRSDWQAEADIRAPRPGDRPTGWARWLVFAGVMLGALGLLQAMAGLTALFNDQFYVVPSRSLLIKVDYDAWGWALLVLGVLSLVAAYLLLRGNLVGRVLAGILAVGSVLFHFAFASAYPWWSVLAIGFNVLVIYAITMHGAELKEG
jgi:hypothetical protein